MILNELLKEYQKGVNVKTGKPFSVRAFSELLKVDKHRLQKWQQRNTIPSLESDRKLLKNFFGIERFEEIEESILKDAIERYPKPALEAVDNAKAGANAPKAGGNPAKKESNSDNPEKPDEGHENNDVHTSNLPPERPKKKVPILGEGLAGTDMELNMDNTPTETDYIDVGDLLKDSEAAFVVYGNSMMPNYPPGAILGIRRNYDGFIQPGEIYLLETRSNRIFKRLYDNAARDGYECYSDNDLMYSSGGKKGQLYYPSFEVKYSDVIRLFDITGVIKRTRNSGIMLRQR